MTIALCCDTPEISQSILTKLAALCAAPVTPFYSGTEFLTAINEHPDTVMLIAQKGALSTETAMSARERNPNGNLIWFSDLDFALLSFRIKATYFGLFPIEDEKLKIALSYCGIPLKNRKDGDSA